MQKICLAFSNNSTVLGDDDDFFIFILLLRESDGVAMHRTNPDSIGAGSRVPGGAKAPPELFLAPPESFEPPLTIEQIIH